MKLDSLNKLYVDELKDIYSAETQITKAMPFMVRDSNFTRVESCF